MKIYMASELADIGKLLDVTIFDALGVVAEITKYQQEIESGRDGFNLFRVMSLSRAVSATGPRDKIYGLLALMDEDVSKQVHPTYNMSVEEVYIDFARLTIDVK